MMIRNIVKFKLSLIKRQQNPYLNLPIGQLHNVIKQNLLNSLVTIQSINNLIYLSAATNKNYLDNDCSTLIYKSVQKLEQLQNSINQHDQDKLKELQIAKLVAVIAINRGFTSSHSLQKLSMLYANTYCHLFTFQKHIQIYENSLKIEQLDYMTKIAQQAIKNQLLNNRLSLSQYIAYLRLFHSTMSAESLNKNILLFINTKQQKVTQIENNDKLILYFISMNKNADLSIISCLQPNLQISKEQEAKWTCIKLQILRNKKLQIPNLTVLQLQKWDLKYLIWISEFVGHSTVHQKLHKQIINKSLQKDNDPFSLLTYAKNCQIGQQKHKQLSNWLCSQNSLTHDHEKSLCLMLIQIDQNNWEQYYLQFYETVLKMSLGNFQWESQNIVYYYGVNLGLQKNQNMQYLRRYILNTYAALGTARREVPTSSYFYKILAITKVQQFYGRI